MTAQPGRNPAVLWIALAYVAALLLQLELVFSRPVNWDEFFHLSEAHAFHQGRLTEALQVFYARAFFWLPMLPVDAVDQIRVARVFMLGFELTTVAALVAIAQRFVGRVPALIAGLAYLTGGYVFEHGFSYRADPMAAAFLMGALAVLMLSRLGLKHIALAALLGALAAITTIKIVFYLPAFAAAAWWRWHLAEDRRDMLKRLALLAGATIALSLLALGLTLLSLPPEGHGSAHRVIGASGTMMFDEGLFPRWPYAIAALGKAPVLAFLLLCAPLALNRARKAGLGRAEAIMLACLFLPLLSIAIYRNSFPYYYVFILPPAAVAIAFAAREVLEKVPVPLFALALLANAGWISWSTPREVLPVQQQVLAVTHRMFPQPVAYFDFPGMIADFPKANFFMTTWGMRKYWAGIEEDFAAIMARETVPLLVANQEPIERNQTDPAGASEFKPEDRAALREGFIPHWGPIWVAGRRFAGAAPAEDFLVRTPGLYTLEGEAATINGRTVAAGTTIMLERGRNSIAWPAPRNGETVLRWGKNLYRPNEKFGTVPVFKDF